MRTMPVKSVVTSMAGRNILLPPISEGRHCFCFMKPSRLSFAEKPAVFREGSYAVSSTQILRPGILSALLSLTDKAAVQEISIASSFQLV